MPEKTPKENTTKEYESASQSSAKERKKSARKKIGSVALALIVLASALFLAYEFVNQDASEDEQQENGLIEQERTASEAESEGDIEAALAAYRNMIDESDDDSEKAAYYLAKSGIAQRDNNTELAITYAERSLELDETANAYVSLAALSDEGGDKESAITYYEKALELKKSFEEVELDELDYLEELIDQLKSEVAEA